MRPEEELANAELAIEIFNDSNRKRLRTEEHPSSSMQVDSIHQQLESPRPPKRVFKISGHPLLTAAGDEEIPILNHETFGNHFLQCLGASILDSQAPC